MSIANDAIPDSPSELLVELQTRNHRNGPKFGPAYVACGLVSAAKIVEAHIEHLAPDGETPESEPLTGLLANAVLGLAVLVQLLTELNEREGQNGNRS